MLLIHNGTVRSWSREDHAEVKSLEVVPDRQKISALRDEYLQYEGIYEIIIETNEGLLTPGDDLLFIVVAGDIREHVKPVLAELLDRIKSEAVSKQEWPGTPGL